ncbi:MAG: AraC family transcriptional regulator, partial [Oscillospiraceae bacterium]|nr:AraC family transcriptional regulator [Oscillospiraceae bacterium]
EYLDNTTERKSSDNQQVQAVKKMISYLREHFLERITIDELCADTGYSRFYLCHSFKKMTGNTIIQYVNFLKCQHARSLLLEGNHSVSESAALSGFKNDSYFTKTYKAVFGRLPSDDLRLLP